MDLGTLTAAEGGSACRIPERSLLPSYEGLSAVKSGEVYAVNPHTSMNVNHETCLANAYYIDKVLYPEQFADIDPRQQRPMRSMSSWSVLRCTNS
ncbi:MAG: hypothetical protein MJ014_01605 [Methanocorpusculum sp.]|nr:hypothetical protein [Methanocorpusculum sp.]